MYLWRVPPPFSRVLFGLKVRQLRQQKALSFAELSRLTGMSVSFLNEIEKGKKTPRPDKVQALAESLGCCPDWLASGDPGSHLAPVAALLESNFLAELPLDLFGIDTGRLLELLAEAPAKVNAFVSSLLDLAQDHNLGAGHFYLSAIRAYQELNNNHFPELEQAAAACRVRMGVEGPTPSIEAMKDFLTQEFRVRIVKDGLAGSPELGELRSVWVASRRELLLNPNNTAEQLRFQLAKEIGFHWLALEPRPAASTVLGIHSFAEVLHNYQSGYFAVALLIDQHEFMQRLEQAVQDPAWRGETLKDWLELYFVSPDVLFQRMNVLGGLKGFERTYFRRIAYRSAEKHSRIEKELHLYREDRHYAGRLNETYCSRWLATQLAGRLAETPLAGPLTGLSRVRFSSEGDQWLCLGMARQGRRPGEWTGLELGLLLDDHARTLFPFSEAEDIPEESIGLTCERCPDMQCKDRLAPPVVLEEKARRQAVRDRLREISG